MDLRIGSLCTGTAAIDHAVQELIGGELVWVSDIKPAAEYLLSYRYPDIPNLGDIKLVDWSAVEPIDVLVGSWPCQPHSPAGKRKGIEDPRDLWPWYLKAIRELKPRLFFGENVARICTNGELARVARSLAEIGYLVAWHTNTAESVGAPHKRQRTFIVAVSDAYAIDGDWSGYLGT